MVYGDDFDEIPVRQSLTAFRNNVPQKDGGITAVAKKVPQSECFFDNHYKWASKMVDDDRWLNRSYLLSSFSTHR